MLFMDDTQKWDQDAPIVADNRTKVDVLESLDPAEAPEVAERYADELADELENAGRPAAGPADQEAPG